MSITLHSSIKNFNGYKVCHPEKTIERITNGFKKLNLGIVQEGRVDAGVYISSMVLKDGLLTTSGKGLTPLLCQASGYAELAERFSTCWIRDYRLTRFKYQQEKMRKGPFCSYTDLKKDKVNLNYFFASFYRDFKKETGIINLVQKFPLFWQPSYSLIKDRTIYFPLFWAQIVQGTNGVAAGNSLEEAIMHAICEVVERYVTSMIILNRHSLPTVAPDFVTNNELKELMGIFRDENIEFVIKDCTMGLPLPSVGILFTNKDCRSENNFVRARNNHFVVGTSTDPEMAAIRCFTEYAQCYWKTYHEADNFWKIYSKLNLGYKPDFRDEVYLHFHRVRLYDESFLRKKTGYISFSDISGCYDIDYLIELKRCLEAFSKMGYDLLCVDFTHPILNFPAVQVIIPEMSLVNIVPEIVDVFSHLAETRKIIFNDSLPDKIIKEFVGYKPAKRIENFLLSEKWYDNKDGIKEVIRMIEKHIIAEPIERAYIMDICAYELLAYLYISLCDYEKAYKCSHLMPELLTLNMLRKHEMLLNYARIQEYLKSKSYRKDPKSNGIIKILHSLGISTNLKPEWLSIGNPDASNPVALCDFNCKMCSDNKNECIWKIIPIEDFFYKRR